MNHDPAIRQSMKTTETSPNRLKDFFVRWKFPVIIIACIIAVYGQSLTFDFVNYDDPDLIVQNQDFLSKPGNIFTSFTSHVFVGKRAESSYYRPLLQVSYILDYQIWQLNPFGYHLTNLLIHIITSILIFYLLRKLLVEQWISLFASLLFALHPVQTESVAWIAGRNDLLLGLWIVIMLLSYMQYREQTEKRVPYYILSIVSFALAIFTKEPAAFYLLVIPIYDRCFTLKKNKELFTPAYLLRFAPFVAIFAGYMLIRILIFGEMIGTERLYSSTPLGESILHTPALMLEHISLLVIPVKLSVVHPLNSLFWLSAFWSIIATILLYCCKIVVFVSWRIDRVLSFGLLLLATGLLPVSNMIPLSVPILEHRLYIPVAGAVLILARLIILLRASKASSLTLPVTVGLLLLAAGISFFRLPVWKNSESLWRDAIEKAPTASRSYFNLSGYYFDLHQYDNVIPLLENYVRLEPFDNLAYSKLRQTYFFAGRYDDAARVCKTMIAFNPTNAQRYIETGILYERLNQLDSAYAIYKQGLVADLNSFQLHYQLGIVSEHMGITAEAETHYNNAIALNSKYAPALYALGNLYANSGNIEKAISTLETSLTFAKPPQEVLTLLHNLYGKTKQEEKYFNLLRQLGISP